MSGKEKEKKENDKSVGRRPRCTRVTGPTPWVKNTDQDNKVQKTKILSLKRLIWNTIKMLGKV